MLNLLPDIQSCVRILMIGGQLKIEEAAIDPP